METFKKHWQKTPRPVRKVLVIVAGTLVLIAGVIMLAIPGPGWATIFLALAIFATEFAIANRAKQSLIKRFKQATKGVKQKFKGS
jgi:uncharacterized protein (TIGR02611 family)